LAAASAARAAKGLGQPGGLPERDSQRGARPARQAKESKKRIIDATERRRPRPKNPEKQALHSSGKKKTHTDKNVLVVNASSQRVRYLGTTHAGSVREKKIVDQEPIAFPPDVTLYKDAGFQGYEPPVARTCLFVTFRGCEGGAALAARDGGPTRAVAEWAPPARTLSMLR
jgi:hypothetical protein